MSDDDPAAAELEAEITTARAQNARARAELGDYDMWRNYPPGWPACRCCGDPALEATRTCGKPSCDGAR